MMNKKAEGGLVMNKLIILILIILVILAVIIGIWKFGLIDKIKNLFPDFNKTASDNGNGEVNNGVNLCPVKIGEIRDNYIFVGDSNTNLLWYYPLIRLDEWTKVEDEWTSEIVGNIDSDNKVSIIKDWFYSEKYTKHPKMPSLYVLRILDGSYKQANSNFLCREKEIKELKAGDKIDLNNIPKEWKLADYSNMEAEIIIFLDDYGFEILINKETREIQRLMKGDNGIIAVWIEKQ